MTGTRPPVDPDRADAHAIEVCPLTPARWTDFETLFGPRGACGGCWCMLPRLTRAEFDLGKGEGNRQAMRAIVEGGEVPGVLGFAGGRAVAWCALGPRQGFPWLSRSRILRPVDQAPVWSIVCLFIDARFRRLGVSTRLIRAACDYAATQGAAQVEAYPIEPRQRAMAPAFAWTGIASAYVRAGFREVARRAPTRPILRCQVGPGVVRDRA